MILMHLLLCSYLNGCGVYSTEIFSYGQALLVTWLFFLYIYIVQKNAIFLKVTKILIFKLKWLSSGEKKWTLEIQDVCCWFLFQLWFSAW